ncbi:MAG TPA: MFS transporter [Aliidongia sp.]|nr:MFS transporter [Aliidongia sp.]
MKHSRRIRSPMPPSNPRPMLVALIVACALFMENLDGTVISTALPAMARSFGTSPIRLSLGITVYMLSLAVFIPISGWVADRFGARTIFRAAIGVFTLGSMLCGLCHTLPEFVAARILQGIGGAMMVPVGRLAMLRSVDKSELVRAMAYLTVPALIGPVLGAPLGGFITTFATWRWIFFLNVPIGVLGMVLATIYIENFREENTPPLDWLGFLLTGSSLSVLIYGLEAVGRDDVAGWQPVGLIALGLALGIAAVGHSRRHPHPLTDLSLLRLPTFASNIFAGSLFRVGVGALPFLLPLMLQVTLGYTPFVSGLLTLAASIGALAMKTTARPILRSFGFRTVLVVNGLISAVTMLATGFFTAGTPAIVMLAVLLLGGFFRSLQFTSLNTIAYADIPVAKMSAATSFSGMVQQVALALGVAFGAILLHVTLAWRGAVGGTLSTTDFRFAYGCVALLSVISVLLFRRLEPAAGAAVSGHRLNRTSPAPGDD